MQTMEGTFGIGLSRTVGLALACLATSLIFTGVTLVFTAGAHAAPSTSHLAQASVPGTLSGG